MSPANLELLSGFEPETSSLPIQERLFSPIAAYCILLPRSIMAQRVGPLGCCVLLCALDNFFILFFDARMGFVWVSCRTHTARPHPFICTFCLQAVKICDILSMALHKSAGG